jgi:hypothetical protein
MPSSGMLCHVALEGTVFSFHKLSKAPLRKKTVIFITAWSSWQDQLSAICQMPKFRKGYEGWHTKHYVSQEQKKNNKTQN